MYFFSEEKIKKQQRQKAKRTLFDVFNCFVLEKKSFLLYNYLAFFCFDNSVSSCVSCFVNNSGAFRKMWAAKKGGKFSTRKVVSYRFLRGKKQQGPKRIEIE